MAIEGLLAEYYLKERVEKNTLLDRGIKRTGKKKCSVGAEWSLIYGSLFSLVRV